MRRTGAVLHAGALALAVVMAAPVSAQPKTERPDDILVEAGSRTGVRAMLLDHAESVQKSKRNEAADAYYYAGVSYARAGKRDSAIVCYERALDLRRGTREAIALADEYIRRARKGDAERARAHLAPLIASTPRGDFKDRDALDLRLLWLQHQAGHADSALAVLKTVLRHYEPDYEWMPRVARVAFDGGDLALASQFIVPVALASRGFDPAVRELLFEITTKLGREPADAERIVLGRLAQLDERQRTLAMRIGARRAVFRASDRFALGAAAMTPRGRTRGAVILMAPGDSIASYDSLMTVIDRAGFAVIAVEIRGHGQSAGEGCALPSAWIGRENELEDRVAADVRDAFFVLQNEARADSSGYVVVGVGGSAGMAVRAAELDPRVKGVVLASADPARVDRGVIRERVARLQRPLFLQIAPEDLVDLYYYTDALYQAGDRKRSRVSDSQAGGRFAQQFRRDPRSAIRLAKWLDEVLPEKN